MNDYSNLYGNPETSNRTFVPAVSTMKTPYGDAIDEGQFMSANNLLPKNINFDAIAGLGKSIIGGIASIYEYQGLSNQIDDTIYEMRRALDKNRAKVLYDWRKQNASDMLSFWGSGVSTRSGSAAAVLTSNENVVKRNISEMEYEVNQQIRNLKAQKENAKKQGIISSVGSIAGAALAFSDKRLKTGLVKIGKADNGLNIYLGKYTKESGLDDEKTHLFLIAQEVQQIRPDAVIEHENGYLMVDYKKALE